MYNEKGKRIHIGTSGWHYIHWMGIFYPAGIRQSQFLAYYQQTFQTVEINNSFYRLPAADTFALWRESVPDNFIFAVKGSRFITHMKKLKDPQASFANFFPRVDVLGEKLGPILFQLPPVWMINVERFQNFAAALPHGYRYTFEFRHPSWYDERIYAILRQYNIAFCIYEFSDHWSPKEITADFVYIRLHGPEGKYSGSYSDEALQWWAGTCKSWVAEGKDVFFYFDNDMGGHAAFNAKRLAELTNK